MRLRVELGCVLLLACHGAGGPGRASVHAGGPADARAGTATDARAHATTPLRLCERSRKLEPIIEAPFPDDEASLVWTGEQVLIWSREGTRAAAYAPAQRRWTSLDDRFPGMRVHGVAGRHLVVAREGQFPQPLEGLVVDAHDGGTARFRAPAKVWLEPLTIGDALLFSTDATTPLLSMAPLAFEPASGRWTAIEASPLRAWVQESAIAVGSHVGVRFGGRDESGVRADGSILDVRSGERIMLGEGGPGARVYALAAVDADAQHVAILGGMSPRDGQLTALDDGGMFALAQRRWQPIPALGAAARELRGIGFASGALFAWGTLELSRLDVGAQRWTTHAAPRALGREVITADAGLLFVDAVGALLFDPADASWCEVALPEAARQRSGEHVVWTGSHLLLWGGVIHTGSGGCEDHRGPEGCDPWVTNEAQGSGWLL